jgi:RHS repeat-associated protein
MYRKIRKIERFDIRSTQGPGLNFKKDNQYVYELSDHLGNVRATYGEDASGDLQTYTYSDYFPFGMKIPGRLKTAGEYRFGYQGQFAEEDEETGYNAFEARLWDNRAARWMAPDPAGQYWSPYLGMGNSPISGVDPDGESVWGYGLTAGIGALIGYGIAELTGAENPWLYAAVGAGIGAGGGYYLHTTENWHVMNFFRKYEKIGEMFDRAFNGAPIEKVEYNSQYYFVAKGGLVPVSYYDYLKNLSYSQSNKAAIKELNSMDKRINYTPTITDNVRTHYIGDYNVENAFLDFGDLDNNALFRVFYDGILLRTIRGTGESFGINSLRMPIVTGNSRITTVLNPGIFYSANHNYQFYYNIKIKF